MKCVIICPALNINSNATGAVRLESKRNVKIKKWFVRTGTRSQYNSKKPTK